MGFDARIENLRNRVDSEIQNLFRSRRTESLYKPMFHLLESGGKRIRPLLLILSCQAVGGDVDDCIHAAVAAEIFHTFTLVHDDIMDHDGIRRGRPTVHEKWDEATAILAGDGLVTLAYQTLLNVSHPRMIEVLQTFTNGLLILCEGQAMDKAFETRETIALPDYEEMIEKKTARLMEVVCEAGAILGNGCKADQESLRCFGLELGKGFQVQDDILDILSEESVTGKPVGSDIVERKKTYLTIHFMSHASNEEIKCYQTYLEKKSLSREDILHIRELFRQAGTFEGSRQAVDKHIGDALDCLDELPSCQATEDLRRLALKIQNRVH
jgi:geranylgeranyl pyrophosphate synthase